MAARAEGREVDAEQLRSGLAYWLERSEIVIVEGAGGLMSPASDDDFTADLAFEFGFPLVVVAPNELGTINQTLQTLVTASTFRDGIDIAGIVLNSPRTPADDASRASNRGQLERYCRPPLLAELAWRAETFSDDVDWHRLARAPRS